MKCLNRKMTLLTGKAGVTILEGVIAIGLLALIMAGAFGVLLSSSHKTSQPDMREEMLLAVESAHHMLKAYAAYSSPQLLERMEPFQPTAQGIDYSSGLCGDDTDPMALGEHSINCLLPLVCDTPDETRILPTGVTSLSSFKYTVSEASGGAWPGSWLTDTDKWEGKRNPQMYSAPSIDENGFTRDDTEYTGATPGVTGYAISFNIVCNGYEL